MKTNFIRFFVVAAFFAAFLLSGNLVSSVRAQSFDESYFYNDGTTFYGDVNCVGCDTTYPTFDTGSYPTFDDSYRYNDGTTFYGDVNCVGCDTSYPTFDTGTSYPTFDTGTYYPTFDTGTSYPTFDTGTSYPTFDTGITYPSYTDVSYTTSPSWTGYSYPSYGYGSTYSYPTYNYSNYSYPVTPVVPVQPVTPVVPVQPPMCPMDARICPDGSSVGRTGPNCTFAACPTTNVTVCSDGLPRNANGTCVRTTTIPVVNTTICADGFAPVNGTCVRTNTIPVINNTVCADGLAPINGSCVRTVVAPTVTYQTCWDGSVIPLYSVCPAQYKTCANGTSVPVNQQCYYAPTPTPYVPPVTIKFNNVITSVVTEITKSSARCNGIGLIASNAPSTGWFEYGETANLGRETAKANIGSSATAPFSNVLVNLKPSTTYYCRAVMQNQYGTVKGEIVSFKTKATAVTYVKPVTQTTVKKTTTTTKPAPKKSEIICIDGTIVSTGSKTSADLLNSGQKLISLQMEKVSGNLAAGSVVSYRLGFKNLSDEALRNVTIKVTIPAEVTFMQASSGTYDPTTRTLTTMIPSLPAGAEGSVGWTGSVISGATVGKPVAMTGYAGYTVPGTNTQDEVTAYTVGSIVSAGDGATTTGAKKVVGATSTAAGFLPNSLVEWLALIAIIFIIFILARSVYSSYRDDRPVTH